MGELCDAKCVGELCKVLAVPGGVSKVPSQSHQCPHNGKDVQFYSCFVVLCTFYLEARQMLLKPETCLCHYARQAVLTYMCYSTSHRIYPSF